MAAKPRPTSGATPAVLSLPPLANPAGTRGTHDWWDSPIHRDRLPRGHQGHGLIALLLAQRHSRVVAWLAVRAPQHARGQWARGAAEALVHYAMFLRGMHKEPGLSLAVRHLPSQFCATAALRVVEAAWAGAMHAPGAPACSQASAAFFRSNGPLAAVLFDAARAVMGSGNHGLWEMPAGDALVLSVMAGLQHTPPLAVQKMRVLGCFTCPDVPHLLLDSTFIGDAPLDLRLRDLQQATKAARRQTMMLDPSGSGFVTGVWRHVLLAAEAVLPSIVLPLVSPLGAATIAWTPGTVMQHRQALSRNPGLHSMFHNKCVNLVQWVMEQHKWLAPNAASLAAASASAAAALSDGNVRDTGELCEYLLVRVLEAAQLMHLPRVRDLLLGSPGVFRSVIMRSAFRSVSVAAPMLHRIGVGDSCCAAPVPFFGHKVSAFTRTALPGAGNSCVPPLLVLHVTRPRMGTILAEVQGKGMRGHVTTHGVVVL